MAATVAMWALVGFLVRDIMAGAQLALPVLIGIIACFWLTAGAFMVGAEMDKAAAAEPSDPVQQALDETYAEAVKRHES